jgi:hypothetical protein
MFRRDHALTRVMQHFAPVPSTHGQGIRREYLRGFVKLFLFRSRQTLPATTAYSPH